MWTVLETGYTVPNGAATLPGALCRCICGTERIVAVCKIGKRSKTCGSCTKKGKPPGDGQNNYRHGQCNSPTYISWYGMKYRCSNPKNSRYKDYGGRGISVCERWLSFTNFLADMGERPEGMTIDRKNVNGNYEPSNCRWATPIEQSANKRHS